MADEEKREGGKDSEGACVNAEVKCEVSDSADDTQTKLDQRHNNLEFRVEYLESRLKTLKEKRKELEAENIEQKGKINDLCGKIDAWKEVDEHHRKLYRINAENEKRYKATINQLGKEITRLRAQAGDRTSAFKDIEKEFEVSDEPVLFSDIGGLEPVLEQVRDFELGVMKPELFKSYGIDPPNGLIMYGPPGCGKTMTARAISYELNCPFLNLHRTKYVSEWINAPGKKLSAILQQCADYTKEKDTKIVIFVDEAEQVFMKRGSYGYHPMDGQILDVWLNWIDGMNYTERLIFMAATNRVDIFDEAVLSRLQSIEVPKPDRKGVEEILTKIVATNVRKAGRDIYRINDYSRLADMLYRRDVSGREIRDILKVASTQQIRILGKYAEMADQPPPAIYQFQIEKAIEEFDFAGKRQEARTVGF